MYKYNTVFSHTMNTVKMYLAYWLNRIIKQLSVFLLFKPHIINGSMVMQQLFVVLDNYCFFSGVSVRL